MCEPVPESQRMQRGLGSAWLNGDGRVIHPHAPYGAGGAGLFTRAGLIDQAADEQLLPHPHSPGAGGLDPGRLDQAQQLQDAAATTQPAPRLTADSTQAIQGMAVTIEKDVQSAAGSKTSGTQIKGHGGKVDAKQGGDGKWQFTLVPWKVRIWTDYNVDADRPAAYGRGTTEPDRKSGNTTLGFHESCHRADFIAYLTTKPLPEFSGRPDMSAAEAQAAISQYLKACKDYFNAAYGYSETLTDEVGKPTRSAYKAAHPG